MSRTQPGLAPFTLAPLLLLAACAPEDAVNINSDRGTPVLTPNLSSESGGVGDDQPGVRDHRGGRHPTARGGGQGLGREHARGSRRPAVVLFEHFEASDWERHWTSTRHPENYAAVTTPVFRGRRALEVRVPTGSHSGNGLEFAFAAKGLAEPDAIYIRYYVRFNDTWQRTGDGEIGKLPGPSGDYGRCGFGARPADGTCWSARMINFDMGSTHQLGFYTYHLDMEDIHGEHMRWAPLLERDRWYCVETYVQLNSLSSTGAADYDGVLRGWVDGALAFERTNLRFRNVGATHVEKIWWHVHVGGSWTADRDMVIHFDDAVVARRRIGCHPRHRR